MMGQKVFNTIEAAIFASACCQNVCINDIQVMFEYKHIRSETRSLCQIEENLVNSVEAYFLATAA